MVWKRLLNVSTLIHPSTFHINNYIKLAVQREASSITITLLSLHATCRKWLSLFRSAVGMVRCVSAVAKAEDMKQEGVKRDHSFSQKKVSIDKKDVMLQLVVRGLLQELRLATQAGRLLDPNVAAHFGQENCSTEETPATVLRAAKEVNRYSEEEEDAHTSGSQESGTESGNDSCEHRSIGSSDDDDDDESNESELESPEHSKTVPAAVMTVRSHGDHSGRLPPRQGYEKWNLQFHSKKQTNCNYVHLFLEHIQDRLLGAFLENELSIAWKFNEQQPQQVVPEVGASTQDRDQNKSELNRLVGLN